MRNFENAMKALALKSMSNKSNLWRVYSSGGGDDRVYRFEDIGFYFIASSPRSIEKTVLFVDIPARRFPGFETEHVTAAEDFIARTLFPKINSLYTERKNPNKDASAVGEINAQKCGGHITRRGGIAYSGAKNAFCLRLSCRFPLLNGTWVNVKASIRMVKELMRLILPELESFDREGFFNHLEVNSKQRQIRAYLRENRLCAFVADGSILPRENGTEEPMKNALAFLSPEEMRIKISFKNSGEAVGMAVPKGVTVITGGGYSGKTTLLDALEAGIYDHVPGDGRELVISDDTAMKICAEDGRPVSCLDISPFFRFLQGNADVSNFSTAHASGSVSQAANIIEAVCGSCGLLLIDEDKSATNFMIRDALMRKIVKREPIVPFTDRVGELCSQKEVSTILVIGGSGEYLSRADRVLLIEEFILSDITAGTDALCRELKVEKQENTARAHWESSRYLIPKEKTLPFLFIRSVSSENQKRIVLDQYTADITALTALTSEYQQNTLAAAAEVFLTDSSAARAGLAELSGELAGRIFSDEGLFLRWLGEGMWLEAVRPIDIFCCMNRMRGVFIKSRPE